MYLVLTTVATIVFICSFETVYATTNTLSDANSCIALGGSWSNAPPTCTMLTQLVISAGDVLIINAGVTLDLAPTKNLVNMGSITNNGIITVTGGVINNNGNIDNMGTGIFSNFGTINLSGGVGDNSGTIINRNTATFSNFGTININGNSGFASGNLVTIDTSMFSNSGSITLTGDSGMNSGRLRIIHNSVFSNLNLIIINSGSGQGSGYLGTTHFGKFTNKGTLEINGGVGVESGQLDNWNDASIVNSGIIKIIGDVGKNSGQLLNMGDTIFTNTGQVTIFGGTGDNSGRLVNSENGIFINNNGITILIGPGLTNFPLVNKDGSTFKNTGKIITAKNLRNAATINNVGTITIENDLDNPGNTFNNCGIITINGVLIGNAIIESKCSGGSDTYEDPTIGKSRSGKQVVENGICIDIQCWTVTADYHQDFELVEMLSDSTHTISTTVFCQNGVVRCNYVAFGVSPYGTNINDSVWKIILQKDHKDKWTMKVIDPDGYLGEVTSTTQIINDAKNLAASATIEFKKPTPGMILNVEVRDSKGGYRDFKFNDGIEIKDAYAYPFVPTSYEDPIKLKPLCLNENPNKRYTCAFDMVRQWTLKNAEKALADIK